MNSLLFSALLLLLLHLANVKDTEALEAPEMIRNKRNEPERGGMLPPPKKIPMMFRSEYKGSMLDYDDSSEEKK